jgi:oleate hydratase
MGIIDQMDDVLENTIVRTTFMPYITSMFMPRAKGDRPGVVPEGYINLGLVGQFVETNNDVVFTMESSIRTARIAVYELLNINKQVPDINPLQYDIRHLLKAAKALNDNKHIFGEGILRKVLKGTYFEHVLPVGENGEDETHEFILTEQLENFQDWIKGLKK